MISEESLPTVQMQENKSIFGQIKNNESNQFVENLDLFQPRTTSITTNINQRILTVDKLLLQTTISKVFEEPKIEKFAWTSALSAAIPMLAGYYALWEKLAGLKYEPPTLGFMIQISAGAASIAIFAVIQISDYRKISKKIPKSKEQNIEIIMNQLDNPKQ